MHAVKALYKLARPFNALSGALAVIVGGYVAGSSDGSQWLRVLMAALVTFLITASSNAWNDYLDIEIDRINRPDRVLPAGHLLPRTALIFSLTLALLSLLLSAGINAMALMIALASNVLLFAYSWRLKSTVLLGNLVVAFISAVTVIFGGVAANADNLRPTIWLAVVILVGILSREVLKVIADYEGDLRQDVRTVATVWGKRTAGVIFHVMAAAIPVLILVPYLVERYRPIYITITFIGVYPVLFYIFFKMRHNLPSPQLERLSQLMKYDFLIWFAAVILGAATAS